jgi:hypothetical protein
VLLALVVGAACLTGRQLWEPGAFTPSWLRFRELDTSDTPPRVAAGPADPRSSRKNK